MNNKLDLTTIILTYNEELHIRRCLENVCPFSKKVYVIDSPSTDRTVEICKEFPEVEVIVHKYPGNQAAQYNWAIDNLPIDTEWTMRIDADEYYLPELVEDIGDAIQVGADKKHISFTVDTAGMKNEDVIADPLRLEQILINVLANAVKFTPDGGQISLRIVQKDTASAGFADFEFHIKDNGIGMSEEFQKHIFEQFARERTSTVSKIQGTGLGLSITKSLVDMMGGRITVESEPGRGSEFTISLRFPVGEAKAGQMIPVSKASDFTGKKLLVVEDNELNLEIASTLLEEAGFEVDTAGNGKIAVEKVEASSAGRYDLILMDVQMPEMDGYEATRRIRALPDKKKAAIPIVAMTANAFEEDQKNALNAGMNGHIAKPLDIQKLFQVLSELLK